MNKKSTKLAADERTAMEEEFASRHASDTDEELLNYVAGIAEKLGRRPTKEETVGYRYIKSRLGHWPGIMVRIGLLEPKQTRKERMRKAIANKKRMASGNGKALSRKENEEI